ncbi:T6SS immunity protein Tdi1 domain-containing protein [Tolumonas lignilytica]|uniref:T6SS immunity protein Tdi1 domain-containing protein n=1 Tax=Tolumonas lignilytica TaxID=1283284 RepID=UPI00192A0AB1|nr:T6SS immunity protein Tdi1 domain-containing protein [Tolumonas lignilytica]
MLKEIKDSWGWVGIEPQEIVIVNEFGNLIIKDLNDKFWRLCPEDVYCKVVAESIEEYNVLIKNEKFLEDWFMSAMVAEAEKNLGALEPGHKYHMVIPGVLGGEYGGKNVKVAPHVEIIRCSGDLGKQIEELPDGAQIQLKVVP